MNRNQLQQGRLLIRTGFIPDFITSIPTMTPYFHFGFNEEGNRENEKLETTVNYPSKT